MYRVLLQITQEGFKYFLTIVDDATRLTWVYLMKSKSNTRPLLVSFYNMICTQFHTKIKVFRTDIAPEFFLKDFFAANGIIHQHSCVATSQQNSVVERKHQHILTMARALKFQSNVPLYLWGECVLTTVHIINRLPSSILNNKSPLENFMVKFHLMIISKSLVVFVLLQPYSTIDPSLILGLFLVFFLAIFLVLKATRFLIFLLEEFLFQGM